MIKQAIKTKTVLIAGTKTTAGRSRAFCPNRVPQLIKPVRPLLAKRKRSANHFRPDLRTSQHWRALPYRTAIDLMHPLLER